MDRQHLVRTGTPGAALTNSWFSRMPGVPSKTSGCVVTAVHVTPRCGCPRQPVMPKIELHRNRKYRLTTGVTALRGDATKVTGVKTLPAPSVLTVCELLDDSKTAVVTDRFGESFLVAAIALSENSKAV